MGNILLVEDDEVMADVLSQFLQLEAHKVKCVGDGKQAMAILEEQCPDLLITDIIMPNMNGLHLIRLIKEKYPSLKIITISGGGRAIPDDFLETANTLGIYSCMTKPVQREIFIKEVNKALAA